MRIDVQHYLFANEDVHQFVRNNPIWYRKLSRDPFLLSQMEQEIDYYYERTFPQKMSMMQNQLQFLSMFIEMIRLSKETVSS